jgi:hypothetical protein
MQMNWESNFHQYERECKSPSHLQKAPVIEKVPDVSDNGRSRLEDVSHIGVNDRVQIPFPIPCFLQNDADVVLTASDGNVQDALDIRPKLASSCLSNILLELHACRCHPL